MNRGRMWIPAGLVLGALAAACGTAAGISTSHIGPFGIPQDIDNATTIDVNNLEMFVTNQGSFAWDLESTGSPPGLFYPKGSENTVVYASGLWFGSTVGGEVRVTVAEYDFEYQPGRIYPDGTWDNPADSRLRVYKIDRGDTTSADYLEWPVADGAPVGENGKPLILGDQTLWTVYNDANPASHSNSAGNSTPQNIEIQQTTFGFNRRGALGNMIYLKFKIFNRGTETLENCYASVWSDPDLGGFDDDLVGCDTTLSLGFCYNEDNDDELYGSRPPSVGYDFFQGPIVPSPGDTAYVSGVAVPDYRNLPMTSFNKYINGTDPDSKIASYNYMRGLDRDGSALVNPDTGDTTTFFVSGDPVTGTGWLDENAADRRFMLSAGPFVMAPGDSQEVVTAIIVAQASDRLSSVTLLKLFDLQAQDVFDANFEVPAPPPQPTVYAREFDQAIDLTWSTDAVGYVELNPGRWEYHHQGYNLYQGESASGPWKKIFTWDVDDTVAAIYRDVVDENANVQRELQQTGANTGLVHNIRLTRDEIRGGSLVNYREYYYALAAYSYDVTDMEPYYVAGNLVGWVTPNEENLQRGVTVVPKASSAVLEEPAGHIAGVSDGGATVHYLDQSQIVEHTYRVTFRDNPDEETGEEIPIVWDLIDATSGDTLLNAMTGQDEGLEDPILTNGFVVDVFGPPLQVKDWDWRDGDRWLSWVNAGLSGFNGGVGLGFEFFGSTLAPGDFGKDVEIRFTDNEADWSDGATFRRDQGYGFAGIGRFPGTVWDVTGDAPRRLNVCFVENQTDEKPADLIWNPDDSDVGGREYLFIMNSGYNGGVDYNDDNFGPEADVIFAAWLRVRPGHTLLEANSTFVLQGNRINTQADIFEFTTHPAGRTEGTVVKNDLDGIRVVPNPYFNQSTYELNQFDRIMKFINLPNAETTIRIFTLGGELVRTIVKDNPAQSTAVWDMKNDQSIPVASGIYIYHVDAKAIGTEVGKLVVFIEKERLNRF